MANNPKRTGRAASMPAGLALGSAAGLGFTLLASGFLAMMLDLGKLAWENVGTTMVVVLPLSAFLGAMVAYGRIKRQRMLVCLVAGAIYYGLLLSITALFFGGQYEAMGVTLALVFAGCGTAALLGLRGEGKKKGKRRPASHR